jgi:hypothetical protein
MAWTRQILSVMGLIMAQLVFGGISLSLGLMVGVLLLGVVIIVLVALAACGFCFILERLKLVPHGWTDEKLKQLKAWAKGSPRMISSWKDGIKSEIRDYLEDKPDTQEQRLVNQVKKLQVVIIMEAIVIAILLVMHMTQLSVRAAIVVVVLVGAVISVCLMYFMNLVPQEAEEPQAIVISEDANRDRPELPGPEDPVS